MPDVWIVPWRQQGGCPTFLFCFCMVCTAPRPITTDRVTADLVDEFEKLSRTQVQFLFYMLKVETPCFPFYTSLLQRFFFFFFLCLFLLLACLLQWWRTWSVLIRHCLSSCCRSIPKVYQVVYGAKGISFLVFMCRVYQFFKDDFFFSFFTFDIQVRDIHHCPVEFLWRHSDIRRRNKLLVFYLRRS